MYPMINVTALKGPFPLPLSLSVLSDNFESTVNEVLGHANFKKIAICLSLYVL